MSAQVIDRKTGKPVTIPEAIPLRGGEQDGDTFIAENYAHYIIHPYYMQRKDPEAYGIMRDFFQGQEYGMPQRTVKEGWHILPWWAARIYQIVARKELPIPAQQRRLSARTSAYEKELAQLWETAKAKLKSGEWTPEEFARQMADVADGAFLPAVAEILGIDESELTAEQRAMVTAHTADNRGWIQDSLMPDIIKALADPEADLGLFDYRIAALYGGALWNLGSLATVTFDGVSMRDLGDMFLFAGPNDNRTCTGERGCQQYVNGVYPVALILAQNIVPGNFVCQHSCRHMLIPIASLPEKQRPRPSPVHSDINLVYGAEKHLPGKHDQMSHGSWARWLNPEHTAGRLPIVPKGTRISIGTMANEYTIESLDYSSYGGARAWRSKQPNAGDLRIVRQPDGKYYVVKPVTQTVLPVKPGVPTGAEIRTKMTDIGKEAAARHAELQKEYKVLNKEWADCIAERSTLPLSRERTPEQEKREQELASRMDVISTKIMDIADEQTIIIKTATEQQRALLNAEHPTQNHIETIGKVTKERQQVWDEGIQAFRSLVPEGIVDEMPMAVTTPKPGTRRSYCDKTVACITKGAGKDVVVHELGHALEYGSPKVHERVLAFYDRRTKGEHPSWLGDDYNKHEVARKDKFPDPYCGKDYGRQHTEIVSMGLQFMHQDPLGFATKDPEYFDFMWNEVLH